MELYFHNIGHDLCELRRHTHANTIDYRTLKRLVQKVFPSCRCLDVHEKHAQALKEAEDMAKEFEEDMEVEDDSANTEDSSKTASEELQDQSGLTAVTTDPISSQEDNNNPTKSGNDTSGCDRNSGKESCDVAETQGSENDLDGNTEIANKSEGAGKEELGQRGRNKQEEQKKARICPGHERALPIQQTVMELDVKEEGISTLLCYLELHDNQWLENMSNVYANCKVQCYAGPRQLQAVAKKCPPVAVAIAKARKEGKSFTNTNSVEFNVVEISDTMGWDSGPVKKELKLLMWNFDAGRPVRTGTLVEFSDLAYHFRSVGDFSIEELDGILQFLHTRVQRQEKSEIHNLSRLYHNLKSVAHRNYYMCSDEVDSERNDRLKAVLNQYFDRQAGEVDHEEELPEQPVPEFNEGHLISDIRGFCNMYGQEHTLTGRAIARIFHGIASPCYPATTWGRVRRFWRCHLDVDFNSLMKIATRELISLR